MHLAEGNWCKYHKTWRSF